MIPLNDLAPQMTLKGAWNFRLGDQGSWGEIQVPGAWEAQGYDRRFEGPAYYRKEVWVPHEWEGSRIFLRFDAVSYACRVIVNGDFVGEHHGLWTAFACDLTDAIRWEGPNLIEVEVYKPSHLPGALYPFRKCLAGFIPDLGTTFGGIWQDVALQACETWLEDLHIVADAETEEILCRFGIRGESNLGVETVVIDVSVSLEGHQIADCTAFPLHSGGQELQCKVPQPRRWSPEDPVLYEVELRLRQDDQILARVCRRVGFRHLTTRGETLLFNGRPVLLRGVLHWGWMPEQIAPFFTREVVRDEVRKVKRMGFNMLKLCLFVPNEILYEVADEEGIFLWQEWPMWLPEIDSASAAQVPHEYAEYMALAHRHPSVVIYSVGCELDATVSAELLGQLNGVMRQGMSGALFCDNSGMGEAYGGLQLDFADFADYHTYSDLQFFEEMLDHWRRDWQAPRPLIFGEFCDSDTYRNPSELRSLGVPWWRTNANPLMDWRPQARPVMYQDESIEAAELGLTHEQLQEISYTASLAIRKFVLETVRRRGGIGGYVITCLRDTPITTSGIFDDFGNPKWSSEQFLSFNGEYGLFLDGERHRHWQHGGDRVDRLDLYNEWAGSLLHRRLILSGPCDTRQPAGQATWRLIDGSGQRLDEGEQLVELKLEGSRPQQIAALTFRLPDVSSPQELRLEAELSTSRILANNHWPLWIYPRREFERPVQAHAPALYDPSYLLPELEELLMLRRLGEKSSPPAKGLIIASALPAWAEEFLGSGGKIMLLQGQDGPLPVLRRPFWREAIRIFASHPFWDLFVAAGDLRFLGVSSDVSFDFARLGEVLHGVDEVQPIFRRLDARDFRVSEYLLEARVGRGVLLACSLRLAGGQGRQPSSLHRNIVGQALLWTMLDYLEQQL